MAGVSSGERTSSGFPLAGSRVLRGQRARPRCPPQPLALSLLVPITLVRCVSSAKAGEGSVSSTEEETESCLQDAHSPRRRADVCSGHRQNQPRSKCRCGGRGVGGGARWLQVLCALCRGMEGEVMNSSQKRHKNNKRNSHVHDTSQASKTLTFLSHWTVPTALLQGQVRIIISI